MNWPFKFDWDRTADIFNSICATMLSATAIFAFVYYNRKKPIVKIGVANVSVGHPGASQLIADPVYYYITISVEIFNDSIYTAYNFRINSIDNKFPIDADYDKGASNLLSNESVSLRISFAKIVPKHEVMKGQPESRNLDENYRNDLRNQYDKPFYINVSYRNGDNRQIKKRLVIK